MGDFVSQKLLCLFPLLFLATENLETLPKMSLAKLSGLSPGSSLQGCESHRFHFTAGGGREGTQGKEGLDAQ